MKIQFSYILLTLITYTVMSVSFSQNDDNKSKNKHHFSTTYSYYYFYDPTPIAQFAHLNQANSSSHSIGLSYIRNVDLKNAWSTSIDFYNFYSQ